MILIWLYGTDDWRSLTTEVEKLPSGKATLVTAQLTVHLLTHGTRMRFGDGVPFDGDGTLLPVAEQHVCPCGATWADADGRWHASGPLALVYGGHVVDGQFPELLKSDVRPHLRSLELA